MSDLEIRVTNEFDRPLRNALVVGVIALALCAVGFFIDRAAFFRAYLIAYVFVLGIPLGCLAIVMIHHLVGGTWGFAIQRSLEAAIATFPIMVLLFLPLLFGLPELFPWARPEAAQDPVLAQKALYLNIPGFIIRAAVYFAVWCALGFFLGRWSTEQDLQTDAAPVRRMQTLSGPGLVVYGLTVTFSAIDWLMSIEPHWYSTIFGMIFMVSHGLVALAFVTGAAYFLGRREPLSRIIAPWVFQDLGNLMLAFIMLWAYLSFSQFLLIWVENLQHEIPWYLHRMSGGWAVIAIGLIVLQFSLPFILLLSRVVKRTPATLCVVVGMVALMHLIEIYWFVTPTFHPDGFYLHWTTVLAPIGVGGVWLAAFLHRLKERPLLPFGDPRFVAIVEEHELVPHG